ncbi:hypothetical protein Sjap_012195 [Stephania japonica]|uniref:Uncharacterized protein n=1 Tax=Stephania japonica TaxID=461633 RepID=A0AAP0IVL1_9MAGN
MAKFPLQVWSVPSQSYKEDEVDRELYEKFPLQFSIIHQFLKELVAKKQRQENYWWKDFHRFCTSTCLYFGKDEQQGKLAVDGFLKILMSSKARGNYNLIDDQERLLGFHHFRSLRRDKDFHEVMSDPIEKEWLHDFHQFNTSLLQGRIFKHPFLLFKMPNVQAKTEINHVKDYIPTFTSSEVERKMEQPSAKEWLEDLDQFCTLFGEKDYTEVVIGEQEKRQWLDEFHQLLALFPENGVDSEVDWNQMEQLARAGPIFGNMQPAISGLLDDKSIRNCYCRIDNVNDANIALLPSTLHASLVFSNSVSNPKKVLDTFLQRNSPNHLQTLLLLGEHKHLIHQVPRELFVKLGRHLNVLDLSRTSITEFPSSFANLRSLRYLDVSGTPITRLPNCICGFRDMQTLRLEGLLSTTLLT